MALNAPYTIRQGDIPCISSDGTLFPVNKLEVHKKGLYHQAVSIFVFDLQGRLLIQRRADDKYHCGGLWANTCCSHPHWGESHEVCASRRLGEELGFTTALTRVSGIEYSADVGGGLWEHENVVVFEAVVDSQLQEIVPNPEEVRETAWVGVEALKQKSLEPGNDFTPWFQIYLERWSELALSEGRD